MRSRLWALIALLAAMMLLAGSAGALGDSPVEMRVSLSKTAFHGIEDIEVTVTVTNISGKDMTRGVSLINPSGKKIKEFGTPKLAAGESRSWTGTWTLTEKQLQKGTVSFTVNHSKGSLSVSKLIEYTPPGVEITRTIASDGGTVTITYQIVNNGAKDMKQVSIREYASIPSNVAELGTVAVGETVSHTFTAPADGEDLYSRVTVTYKLGSKEYTHHKPGVKLAQAAASTSPTPTPAPSKVVLIVDGEVCPLTEEQIRKILDIIR